MKILIYVSSLWWEDFAQGGKPQARDKRNLEVKVQGRLPVDINKVCGHNTSLKSSSVVVNDGCHIPNPGPLGNLLGNNFIFW